MLHKTIKDEYVARIQPKIEIDIESSRAPSEGFDLNRVTHLRKANMCIQTKYLCRRTCRNQLRNPGVVRVRFAQASELYCNNSLHGSSHAHLLQW